MEKLEQKIASCLRDVLAQRDRFTGNKDWTAAITKSINDLVKDEYTVSSPGNYGWLFDITWLEYRNFEERILSRLVLAVESEWQTDAKSLRVDFNKLLIAKAVLSVMIFQDWFTDENGKDIQYFLEIFKKSLDEIRPPYDGRILFAGYSYRTDNFEFYIWDGRALAQFIET